jgi:hypothetical protein
MKKVQWVDDKGWKHVSIVRDNARPEEYPKGLPSDPPDLKQINWEGVQKELHNILIDRGLISFADLQKPNNGLENAVRSVLLKEIISLYKLLEV